MIVLGILFGLVLGLLARGRLTRLIDVNLRWVGLIFIALALRIGTQLAIANGVALADTLRLPLYAAAFALLIAGLWANRDHPGITAVVVGAAANGLAIVVNGGFMPVWGPSLTAAGLGTSDLNVGFHALLPDQLTTAFFLHAGPIARHHPDPDPIPEQRLEHRRRIHRRRSRVVHLRHARPRPRRARAGGHRARAGSARGEPDRHRPRAADRPRQRHGQRPVGPVHDRATHPRPPLRPPRPRHADLPRTGWPRRSASLAIG